MRYFVTFDEFDVNGRPLAAAIDDGSPRAYELREALAHARWLLDEKKHNVTIHDDARNSISGDDLAACCRGDKQITADLRAISN